MSTPIWNLRNTFKLLRVVLKWCVPINITDALEYEFYFQNSRIYSLHQTPVTTDQ